MGADGGHSPWLVTFWQRAAARCSWMYVAFTTSPDWSSLFSPLLSPPLPQIVPVQLFASELDGQVIFQLDQFVFSFMGWSTLSQQCTSGRTRRPCSQPCNPIISLFSALMSEFLHLMPFTNQVETWPRKKQGAQFSAGSVHWISSQASQTSSRATATEEVRSM